MSFANAYLQKQAGPPLISEAPHSRLGLIITIPCFKEPDLLNSLVSLSQCTKPHCATEVIVLINHPEQASPEDKRMNLGSYEKALKWAGTHSEDMLRFYILFIPDLPQKDAGVGMARKIAMDEAVRRFDRLEKPSGIIAGFDADTLCRENYLTALEAHFLHYSQSPGASIYFEHPVNRRPEPTIDEEGIIRYELHMRYVVQGLRYAHFPYAFHTVGSAFAIRALAYVLEGGMNRKKAGEDFYFLHKIFPLGHFSDLNETTVFPSPRPSDRVPFGTGASIRKWLTEKGKSLDSYQFEAFSDLKDFFILIPPCYHDPEKAEIILRESAPASLQSFLEENLFLREISRIRQHSASPSSFLKGFYAWFNGFRIVKYLNYSHQTIFHRDDVRIGALKLLSAQNITLPEEDLFAILTAFRNLDRGINPEP
jgi:hypothetical protein